MKFFVPLWHPPEGAPAGGFVRAKRLLEGMKGHEFIVADTDSTDVSLPTGSLSRIGARRIRSERFHALGRALNWSWVAPNLFVRGLRARDIDAVYIPTGDILAASLPGLLVALVRRIPAIAVTFDGPGGVLWAINRRVQQRFSTIITLSRSSRERMVRDGIRAPIEIGLIGVDQPPQELLERGLSPAWDAVYIARHVRAKGVFDVLEIWKQVVSRLEPARPRLVMAGSVSPPMRIQLARAIEALGLGATVTVLGPVDEETRWRLYLQSRLCLFPSQSEGWGLVPVEAHACGIPVVAYDLPAYAENIASGPGATLVPIGDVTAAAGAVLDYLSGGRTVDASALRAFSRRFTWEAAIAREEELLSVVSREFGA